MLSPTLFAPRPIALGMGLILALGLLLMPMPVRAAPAGTDIDPTVAPLLTQVSPGNTAAFLAEFENTGNSTFTDIVFTATVTNGTLVEASAPCVITGTTVECALGKVESGAPKISLLFLVDAGTAGSDIVFAGTFAGDSASSQGAKRDTWQRTATTPVENDVNVFARWQRPHAGSVEFGAVGTNEYQRSVVAAAAPVASAYAAYVSQRNAAVDCATGTDYTGFGLALDVTVNNGNSPINVTIRYTAAATGNTPVSKIGLVHQRNDGSCALLVRAPVAGCTDPVGCFEVSVEGRGKHQVVVVTAHLASNGRIKGI